MAWFSSLGWKEARAIARDLWRRTRANFRRSPGLAGFSLLIGVVLWLIVTDVENPTRIDTFPAQIPVEAVNVGPDLAVANASLPSVQVRVSAPQDAWDRLTVANFRAFVNLNDLDAREQLVPVQVEVSGVSRARVVDVTPGRIQVNLEPLETRQVPVTTRVVGVPPRGYEPGRIEPDRSTVEVAGPQSLVSRVSAVVASVNVTGLTVGLAQNVTLVPVVEGGGEIRGVAVRPETIRVSVAVIQSQLTRTLPVTAEVTGQPAAGYRVSGVKVTPTTVTIEGRIDVLQALDSLALPGVDVGGQTTDVKTTVRPTLPEGVTIVPSGATVAVEVTITPVAGSIALTLAPEVTNVRQGLLARVNPGSVSVIIDGPLPRLNTLPAGAVRATVDASNLGAGTSDLRVNVVVPDGVFVRQVQPGSVSVTLAPP
ncbi:MAG: CdaR family protein [Dehalococcoidia bacterium]